MRINDSHQDAQQQKSTLGNGLHPADFEKLMQDMEKGLAGMTASVDQLQAKLVASPRVQELAVHEPNVVQLLTDRRLQQTQLRTMRDMQDVLHELNRAMRQPERREQLLAQAQLLQSQVAEVVQDPLWSAALDAPKRRLFAPAMARSLRPHIKTLTRAVPRMAVGRRASGIAIQEGDIGVTPPLGIYDPLNLIQGDATKYRRFQELEIKHGRLAMAATLHVLITEAGFRWPGYLSDGTFGGDPIKFADMPAGTLASWAAMPALGWAQIIAFIALCDSEEIQAGLRAVGNEWLPEKLFAQDPERSPGDVASLDPNFWKRYDDPEVREFKLNAERNNGRAAMMGIVGMIIHEALTGNPLFPIPV
jgi:light-harvesting complex I chlorophyll a/b binding protein 1